MAEFIVLFRLPLNPSSEISKLLREDGWRAVNEAVYFRSVNMSRDEVVEHVKNVCRETRGLGYKQSAFTVIPVKAGTINQLDSQKPLKIIPA